MTMSVENVIKIIAMLGAALIVGNWFLSEVRKSNARKDPWYKPYLSTPGLIIIAAVLAVPAILWVIGK